MAELSVVVSGGHRLTLFVTRGVLVTLPALAPDDIKTNKGFDGSINGAAPPFAHRTCALEFWIFHESELGGR